MCIWVCVCWGVGMCVYTHANRHTQTHVNTRVYIYIYIYISKQKKLATVVKGDSKAPFLIATIPKCLVGRYCIPRIDQFYP